MTKPESTACEKAVARRKLTRENAQLKEVLARSQPAPEMIGNSPAMQEVYRLIDRAGPTDKAILIQGESGTGKELVARALHRKSLRSESKVKSLVWVRSRMPFLP